jgi:hypothetical protein
MRFVCSSPKAPILFRNLICHATIDETQLFVEPGNSLLGTDFAAPGEVGELLSAQIADKER